MSEQPSLWDQTGGKVGNDHPLTSHTAAAKVKSGSQKGQILHALYLIWPDGGYTGYDLSTRGLVLNGAGLPISPNQTCTRLLELREAGLVEFKREFPGADCRSIDHAGQYRSGSFLDRCGMPVSDCGSGQQIEISPYD